MSDDVDVFEWAKNLSKTPGDERLCPWSPNMQHHYISTGTHQFLAGPFVCEHCGESDR